MWNNKKLKISCRVLKASVPFSLHKLCLYYLFYEFYGLKILMNCKNLSKGTCKCYFVNNVQLLGQNHNSLSYRRLQRSDLHFVGTKEWILNF